MGSEWIVGVVVATAVVGCNLQFEQPLIVTESS
jgi:hypothetical protein